MQSGNEARKDACFCGFKGAGSVGPFLGSEAGDGVLMELEHFLHEAKLVLQA